MKQKQFYFIYVFLLSMTFLGACSKDSPNELIPNTIVKIEIDKLPGKRIYFIGEELDVSDMTLKVFYSNETSEIVPVKKDEITGFNNTVPENDQILEVHKGSFTVTFKIQVLINDIQAISIKTLPSKTVYTLGEPLSLSNMVLEINYADGTIKENSAPSADWVQGFNSSVPAQLQIVTLELDGKQVSFDVQILPVKVDGGKVVSVIDSDFTSITFPDGIRTIGSKAFENKNIKASELLFPASLSTIEQAAFAYCRNLKIVDLSHTSIKELPEEAFLFSGIKKIALPASLEIVGKEAFYGCTDLNVIDISHTSVKELQNGAFGKSGISSISLPSTFRIVGASAFIETKNLKELTLPEGSEVIDLEAFSGSSIQKVTLPNTIYHIDRSFYNCPELTTIETYGTRTTPSPVDRTAAIVSECFNHSPKLTVLKIPASIAKIGISALNKCQVKTLILPASVKALDFNAFGNAVSLDEISLMSPTMVTADYYPVPPGIQKIRVPQNLVETYKQNKAWKSFAEKIVAL